MKVKIVKVVVMIHCPFVIKSERTSSFGSRISLSCVTILVAFTSSNYENIMKFKVKDVSQRFEGQGAISVSSVSCGSCGVPMINRDQFQFQFIYLPEKEK